MDVSARTVGSILKKNRYSRQQNRKMKQVCEPGPHRDEQLDYPQAKRLLLSAECGGSNGYNRRMFKKYLADFALETGLEIHICHYPPGCSKYNKIERRLFSQISISMQGRPLTSLSVFHKLIEHTLTSAGLTVQCVLDENVYLKGQKISDKRFAALPVIHDIDLGDWNYVISSLHR